MLRILTRPVPPRPAAGIPALYAKDIAYIRGARFAPYPCVGSHPLSSAAVLESSSATSAAVVFDHVTFAFDEHVVLRDVSFTIPRGSMKILLGASGSGKSVLLKLILGLYRPDSGTILVNGFA
jgi:ABC-type multidrug transport system fused ATPase/permease subunit